MTTKHTWTPAEDQKIRELYPLYSARAISQELGLTLSQVQNRVRFLGLTKRGV